MKRIEYLGYLVDEKGISPSLSNVKAITDYPIPRNTRELQSFIDLLSYFRKFIKDFSLITKPLYNLLKRDRKFNFTDDHLSVFNFLKDKIASQPVLALYSHTAETELHCGTSALGFGAILFQRQEADGKFHPVMIFSKRTSQAESKYRRYELECLGIIMLLKDFMFIYSPLNLK
ncbi:RNase H-like domain found in reverse transcriptase [Popillia japonica]|uniref:RNase H-like domain found in reverse transcriptase n=1 Tax=Popillia japonica TaxID=7064 RepID=A0AAW1I9A2_POPJA